MCLFLWNNMRQGTLATAQVSAFTNMRNFFAAILLVLVLTTVHSAQSDVINVIPNPNYRERLMAPFL